jgi:hypothetical protein
MRLKVWPILAGTSIAAFGTVLVGMLYFGLAFAVQLRGGTSPDDLVVDASAFVIEVVTLLLTGAGGFVAARLAKTAHVRHGASVGIASLLVWLVVDVTSAIEEDRTWIDAAGYAAEILAGALGGYLALRANKPLQPARGADASM